MTTKEFIQAIQNYYSMQYPPGQQPEIYKYLNTKDEDYLDELYDVVTLNYSSKWGKVPDKAVFEEFKKTAIDQYEQRKNRKIVEDLRGVRQISEDDVDLRTMAQERGINTERDGWLAALLVAGMARSNT